MYRKSVNTNWYKRAQEALRHYTDIGHYGHWNVPEENKMVVDRSESITQVI